MNTSLALASLVLIGLVVGSPSEEARSEPVPEFVAAWMDTSTTWASFQAAVEDSLRNERIGRLAAETALAQSLARECGPPWWRWWLLPVATTVGVVIGAAVSK